MTCDNYRIDKDGVLTIYPAPEHGGSDSRLWAIENGMPFCPCQMLVVARQWQSPGSVGGVLARLASTGQAPLVDLGRGIEASAVEAGFMSDELNCAMFTVESLINEARGIVTDADVLKDLDSALLLTDS